MNRISKFRVWTGLSMEYNVVVGKDGAFYALIDKNDTACLSPTSKYHADTPVMQYTGLDDKNNNPIYEGDIIKQIHFSDWDDEVGHIYNGVVKHTKYCDDCDNQISKFATFIEANQNSKFSAGNPIKVDCEIIGNIFMNPELLKQ